MGCGSSKDIQADITTNALRIQITPHETATTEDVFFTKTNHFSFTRSNSQPFPSVDAASSAVTSKLAVPNLLPSKPTKSSSSSSPALLKNKLTPEQKARSRSNGIINVEPRMPRDVTRDLSPRQVSASSRLTTDSGYGDESRPGLSSGSRRTEDEIMHFITQTAERPATPELLIEGTPLPASVRKQGFAPKQTNLPVSVETQNILEKAPLPPIHSKLPRTYSGLISTQENREKQVEQSFDVIQRPPSRGGLAFDILMDIIEKKALKPIEFNPEDSGKRVLKRKKPTSKLTKEAIEAKLAAAESRRKKREQEIIDGLVEQRELEGKKIKERHDRNLKVIKHREATLGERLRTRSTNRESVICAKVFQAHREQDKVANARLTRLSLSTDEFGNTSQN